MIDLQPHADGVVLPVKAQAGARRNALRGEYQGALRVAVTQVAEKGRANKAIVDLLAKTLGQAKSNIELLAGAASSKKKFLVRGVQMDDLRRRLREHLDDA